MTDTANDAQKTATPPTTPVPVSPAADQRRRDRDADVPGRHGGVPDPAERRRRVHRGHLDVQEADGDEHPRLRLREHRLDEERDHVHRRRPGDPALPRVPDRPDRRRTAPSSRSPGSSSTASCPPRPSSSGFDARIRRHTLLHEDLRRLFDALPHSAHPMSVLSSAVSALSTYYEDDMDVDDPEKVELQTVRLLAKLPVIAAYAHKKAIGQAFLYPDNSLSFVDNFLRLNFGTMAETYQPNPVLLEGARAPAHPARGPRAERLDRHGPPGRARRRRTCSRRSPPASTPCTARCTAVRTRPSSRCSSRSRTPASPCSASSSG